MFYINTLNTSEWGATDCRSLQCAPTPNSGCGIYLDGYLDRLGKKHFFVNSGILGMHIWWKKCGKYDKFEIATNCVNQIFNINAFFFYLLTGASWYYHTTYLVFTFTDYEDDIFEIISNLHVQGSKLGGKIIKFGGKSLKKNWTPRSSLSSFFFKSVFGWLSHLLDLQLLKQHFNSIWLFHLDTTRKKVHTWPLFLK